MKITSKYRARMISVKSKVRLSRISDTSSMANEAARRVRAVLVIYRPFGFSLVNVVKTCCVFCLRLKSRRYITGRMAIIVRLLIISGGAPVV